MEKEFRVLDLGCGTRKYNPKDFMEFPNRSSRQTYKVVGVDQVKFPGVDRIVNLEKGKLPFKSNFFDGIFASHVLEHVDNFFPLIKELYRVSKKNGIILVKSPYFSCYRAFTDPEHKRFFTSRTFEYFTEGNQLSNPYYNKTRFNIRKVKIHFGNKLFNTIFNLNPFTQKFYERYLCWIFPAIEVIFELEVIKR